MPESRTIPTIEYKDFSRKVHERAFQSDRVIKAQLELTYRCNLHCVHCYTDPYNDRQFFPRELSLGEIKRILDEMADLEILYLNLTGGEIFTHPNFFDIYNYAYRKGLLLMLYTNGTIFTQAIIERLKQYPPFSIDISCHSVNEEAFDRFTQVPGSFRQFLKGMELLRPSGLPFCFKTKAMNWNKDELPQIRRFVESFGQSFGFTTSLSPRLNGDLSSLTYRLAPEEVRALEDRENYSVHDEEPCQELIGRALSPPPEHLYRCGCATNAIHISAWGELGTCTLQYENRASLRDYSLRDAIRKVFAEVRARRYTTDSPCGTCEIFSFCSKMPTDARWECGDPEAPIPYDCDVALTRAERVSHRKLIHPLTATQKLGGLRHE
ncbi:MAG: radical SAM protein [Nitrospiraceae bacterium]